MGQPSIGERLTAARGQLGASLYTAARETRIRVDFLQHMEADNFRFMSGATYIRGLLRSYARWLGMDEDSLLQEFDRLHSATTSPSVRQILRPPAQRAPRSRLSRWVTAAATAAAVLVTLSLIGLMQPVGPAQAPLPQTASSEQVADSPRAPLPQELAALPQQEGVELTVRITSDRCWLRVYADGSDEWLFSDTLFQGDVKTFRADEVLRINFGNVRAARITLNGRDLGTPPAPPGGLTGTFVFTADTTSFERP